MKFGIFWFIVVDWKELNFGLNNDGIGKFGVFICDDIKFVFLYIDFEDINRGNIGDII